MATCPPHHWLIDMEPLDDVYLARCKECRRRRRFPARIDHDSESVVTIRLSRNIVATLDPEGNKWVHPSSPSGCCSIWELDKAGRVALQYDF